MDIHLYYDLTPYLRYDDKNNIIVRGIILAEKLYTGYTGTGICG